jgi:hypothetical protein
MKDTLKDTWKRTMKGAWKRTMNHTLSHTMNHTLSHTLNHTLLHTIAAAVFVTALASPGQASEPTPTSVPPPASAAPASPTDAPRASARPLRLALTDLTMQGVDARVASVFTESLLVELRKLQRVSVIGTDEVRAMLDFEAQKQLVGCNEGDSCLAELADALGADAVIVGGVVHLGGEDGETVVTLKRVDQRSAAVSQQTNKRLKSAGGEELLAIVGVVVEELFPDVALRDGQQRGVADELAVRLHPPPLPPWAFWSAAGASGVAAASTAVAGVWWAASQQGFRDVAEQSRSQPTPGARVKEREDTLIAAEVTTWVCAGSALVAAVVAGGMVPFVDWDDGGGDPRRAGR